MTEDQRDDIDLETMATIDKCKNGISSLQHSLMEYKKKRVADGDLMSHLIGIVDILQQSLMDTANTFKVFKRERLKKRMQEAEGYFKLDAIKKNPLSPLSRRSGYMPSLTTPPDSKTKEGQRKRSNSINNNNNNSNNNSATNTPATSPSFNEGSGHMDRSNSTNSLGGKGKSSSSTNLTSSSNSNNSDFSTKSSSTPTSPISPTKSSSSTPPISPIITPVFPTTPNNTSLLINRTSSWLGTKNSKGDFNSSAELLDSELKGELSEGDEELLDSERHLLEAENASLQREFDTMVDQVRNIDQQLVAVSGLFETLTEHALYQKETADIISDLTDDAIDYTRSGVTSLSDATRRTVDFRLMVQKSDRGVYVRGGSSLPKEGGSLKQAKRVLLREEALARGEMEGKGESHGRAKKSPNHAAGSVLLSRTDYNF